MPSPVVPMGPFKHGMAWVAYRFTSTVLDDIWPGVFFFTGVATMVVCVSEFTSVNLGINSVMLTVLGTIVSLVVSFKTNNSYSRWWDGRNSWANLTTICRQLAMLIWIHVPNTLPPKEEQPTPTQPDSQPLKDPPPTPTATAKSDSFRSVTTSPTPVPGPTQKPSAATFHTAATDPSPSRSDYSLISSIETDLTGYDMGDGWKAAKGEEDERMKKLAEEVKERQNPQVRAELHGLIEKKSYVGLVQAFAVSMKHALRGETGPFYSDLYSLIAFLPKYNPASYPPITRDHLLALWHNGLPRQKASRATDDIAVPLTVPVAFTQDALNQPNLPNPFFLDEEEKSGGEEKLWGPSHEDFTVQAIKSASAFVKTDDPEVFVVTSKREGRKSIQQRRSIRVSRDILPTSLHQGQHQNQRDNSSDEQVTLETVELMPPRHPPPPKVWDFFPPLRIFKVVYDLFRWRKKQGQGQTERTRGGKRRRMGTTMEIPQEILMYLSSYLADLNRRAIISPTTSTAITTTILELQRAISDLEKIATTPIPSAYTFHLHLTVYFYLFFIPFQVYTYIGWVAIPATAVASVIYLGFLEIGMQIEMPFYYDQSDLDLDEFVLRISHQIAQLTAFPTQILSSHVILSHLNQPFLPTLRTSAPELLGVDERSHHPTTKGFANAFSTYDCPAPSLSSSASVKEKEAEKVETTRAMMKSMRDIELILNANWRDVTTDAKSTIGKPRDQLENRTGLEVAVLKL